MSHLTASTDHMGKIMIVEDEPDISEMIALHLARERHESICVDNGLEALSAAVEYQPDLIVLDLMLPGLDGLSVLRRLRAESRTANIPVIILTAKSQLTDKLVGLEQGVDDYLTKPFSPRELFLRISAVLRRTKKVVASSEIRRGAFVLDRVNLKLYLRGQPLDLTTTEFKFLAMLMESPDAVHARADLLREVWGYSAESNTRTLDTHVKRLREKLGDDGVCIVTVRGTGYQFQVPHSA